MKLVVVFSTLVFITNTITIQFIKGFSSIKEICWKISFIIAIFSDSWICVNCVGINIFCSKTGLKRFKINLAAAFFLSDHFEIVGSNLHIWPIYNVSWSSSPEFLADGEFRQLFTNLRILQVEKKGCKSAWRNIL